VPLEYCAISDPYKFMAGLPCMLGLVHPLTGFRWHHTSLPQQWSEVKQKRTV